MDAHRARTTDRQVHAVARQILLVARVSGFMNNAHQAAHEVVFVVARGDAHILGHAAAKGMGREVEPTGGKVKPEQGHEFQPQCALLLDRERTLRGKQHLTGLLVAHLADHAGQPGLHVAEDGVDVGAAGAGLELVHQRFVAAHARFLRQALRLFACEPDHVVEVRQKPAPVVGRALCAPRMLTARTGQALGFDEACGQQIGHLPVTLHLAQVGGLFRVERFVSGTREQVGQGRIGQRLVHQHVKFGQRRTARRVAFGRHHGRLVPAGDGCQMLVSVETGEGAGQRVIGGAFHGHRLH